MTSRPSSPKGPDERRRPAGPLLLRAILLVAALSILASVTSLGNGFAYDDREIIVQNPRVTDPARIGEVWTTSYWVTNGSGNLFRPLAMWTYAAQHRLHDLKPFGYHLVNVLLHTGASVLVLLLALEYLGLGAALLAGLLFAVHPVHTEAVANVIGRAELLSALGFLLAWVLYPVRPEDRKPWRWALAGAAFLFSLLSKENGVLLPAALLVRDGAARRKPDAGSFAGMAVALGVYLAWRYSVLGSFMNPKGTIIYRIDNVIAGLPRLQGLWTALSVIGRYLVLLVFPLRLSADYSYRQIDAAGAGSPWALLGLVVVLAVLGWLVYEGVRLIGRRAADPLPVQAVTVGLAILALTLLPVSNLLFPIGTVMAERLLYLPSAGFLIALVSAVQQLLLRVPEGRARATRVRVAVAAAILLTVLGTARSMARCREWKDDATIHASTIAVSPRSARARYNYGVTLADAGNTERAVEELEKAVQLDPTYSEAWTNLGGYKIRLKRYDEARRDLLSAVGTDSTWWTAWTSLGALEIVQDHPERAMGYLEKALRYESDNADVWYNVALARAALKDTTGAIEAYRKAAALDSSDPDVYNNLAWYLAMEGRAAEALPYAEKAVHMKADDPGYLDTLGEVYFRSGRKSDAKAAWTRALGLPGADAASLRGRIGMLEEPR